MRKWFPHNDSPAITTMEMPYEQMLAEIALVVQVIAIAIELYKLSK